MKYRRYANSVLVMSLALMLGWNGTVAAAQEKSADEVAFLYEGNLPIKETGGALSGEVSGKYDNVSITFLTVYANW